MIQRVSEADALNGRLWEAITGGYGRGADIRTNILNCLLLAEPGQSAGLPQHQRFPWYTAQNKINQGLRVAANHEVLNPARV